MSKRIFAVGVIKDGQVQFSVSKRAARSLITELAAHVATMTDDDTLSFSLPGLWVDRGEAEVTRRAEA